VGDGILTVATISVNEARSPYRLERSE